eukprot:g38234.t1
MQKDGIKRDVLIKWEEAHVDHEVKDLFVTGFVEKFPGKAQLSNLMTQPALRPLSVGSPAVNIAAVGSFPLLQTHSCGIPMTAGIGQVVRLCHPHHLTEFIRGHGVIKTVVKSLLDPEAALLKGWHMRISPNKWLATVLTC